MSDDRLRAKPISMPSAPPTPVQFFHVEEIVFCHEADVIDECAGHEHTSPADRVYACENPRPMGRFLPANSCRRRLSGRSWVTKRGRN